MQLSVPDDILISAEANEADLRIALAIQLYADNRIEHRDACRLAGLSPSAMNAELLRRGITIQQCSRAHLRRGKAV